MFNAQYTLVQQTTTISSSIRSEKYRQGERLYYYLTDQLKNVRILICIHAIVPLIKNLPLMS